ncbi:hypothetical protein ABH926_001389 [Catenulispora sp. GP43]|uniref:hypothetical protein n=1 Tax=Catenulispora sp. GP43 TaxID=3156263 RepID=UPI0035151A21
MSTDIFETAADGTGTVRAAFDATAAECRPDIDALTRRALDRGQRVRRHRLVGKVVGSAAAAAAIGLGTAYALNDSGSSARPTTIPGSGNGSGTYGGNPGSDLVRPPAPVPSSSAASTAPITPAPTSTVSASVADAVATWRAAHRGTFTGLRAAV